MKAYIQQIGARCAWIFGVGGVLRSLREPRMLAVAYHSIWNESNENQLNKKAYAHISIHREAFRAQLKYLQARGYNFARFSDALNDAPYKRAFIYFDDGFLDVYENAYPILKDLGIPATLFLTTEYFNKPRFDGAYCQPEHVRRMQDIFEIGSHSISHKKLTKVSAQEVSEEMMGSKKILEDIFHTEVVSFSYPHGRSNKFSEEIAREAGYKITTASPLFKKIRPDSEDSLDIFKLKTFI